MPAQVHLQPNDCDDSHQTANHGSGVQQGADGSVSIATVEIHRERSHVVSPLPNRKSDETQGYQTTETTRSQGMGACVIECAGIHEPHGNSQTNHQNEASKENSPEKQTGAEEQPDNRLELEEQLFHGKIFPAKIKLNSKVKTAQTL